MLVIRLERRGRGIFRPTNKSIYKSAVFKRVIIRHGNFNTPFLDGLNMGLDAKEWFCAYKSVEQLQEWLELDEIKYFITKGFKVLMLEVSEFQVGRDQIIFTKEGIISSKDISSLFLN